MDLWYKKIKNDLTLLPDFIEFYEKEYEQAKIEVKLLGVGSIERAAASIPHEVEHRFSQLQDIEAVLRHLNIQYERMRSEVFKKWFENQKAARALSARDAERYVDQDNDVCTLAELCNDTSLIRNMFLAILKGIDSKSYSINNITKLRAAGLEDARI